MYVEILVLGTGARLERINPSVLALLKKKGIAVEVQDTVTSANSQYSKVHTRLLTALKDFNKDRKTLTALPTAL